MPHFRGADLVHVAGGGKTYGEGAKKARKPRFKKLRRNVRTAVSNRTSKPAEKATSRGRGTGARFGQLSEEYKSNRSMNRVEGLQRGLVAGAVGGAVPATAASIHFERKYEPQTKANSATIRANNKKLKAAMTEAGVTVGKRAPKAPRHLITDVGTKAGKHYRPVKPVLAGVAGSTGLIGVAIASDRAQWKGKIENQKKRISNQEKSLSTLRQIGKSAFGVDHERR